MKYLRWLAWLSAAVAVVLMLMGTISLLFGVKFTGVEHIISYFHGATSFLLLAVVLLLIDRTRPAN